MTPFEQAVLDFDEEKINKIVNSLLESFRKDPSVGSALTSDRRVPTEEEFVSMCRKTVEDE